MKEGIKTSSSGQGEKASDSVFVDTAVAFRSEIRNQVRQAFYLMLDEEIRELCGPAWHPETQREYYRAGSAPSSVYFFGERQQLRRPRVRCRVDGKDKDVMLNAWKLAQDPEEWEDAMKRAVLCGVSTRQISQLRGDEVIGESRSNLSRLWQSKAQEFVKQMQESSLSDFNLLVLMLDGVVLCKDLVATVALGVDTGGNKRVLGFRIGSSENKEVCLDLLSRLKLRGLSVGEGRDLFAVLDGSKALKNALLEVFPETIIQRCLVHKERNLRGYLGKKYWSELASLFNSLRRSQGEADGLEACKKIQDFLANKNAQARESFEEAGDELHALFDLNVPNTLNISLLSTNCIENSFKNLRRHIGRVCRWRKETNQADLWVASGLLLAEQGFRKIHGYVDLIALEKALEKSYEKRHGKKTLQVA